MTKRFGFTLAEVLITLGIIGVVAAMTIPTLITNYNQRAWDTGASVFNRKLGEALKVMNSQSALAGYSTTAEFVAELGKHIKIVNTCDSNNLTNCFASEIATGADSIDTSKLKAAKNLYSTEDYGTETIGVQFADGVSALIAYNPRATQDPYSNQIVRVTGSGNSVGFNSDAISILYDVSGAKAPNSYGTGKDIRGLNIAIRTGAAILNLGTNYSGVDCSDSTAEGYEYCNANDIDLSPIYTDNYWVGAQYACAKQGMKLPTKDELLTLYAKKGEEGIPTSGTFWSSVEANNLGAYDVYFDYGVVEYTSKDVQSSVLCISN